MEIKRKFRPTPFTRELYKDNFETWTKQKDLYDYLLNAGLNDEAKVIMLESYKLVNKELENANICINTGRLRRGEYPYKRLRKRCMPLGVMKEVK